MIIRENSQFGDFRLIKLLGKGGMAEVYHALAGGVDGFEQNLALKIIHPTLSHDTEFVQMLIDEAKLSAQLTHPNIVRVFNLGCIEGVYYISMELIEGCDVYQALVETETRGQVFPHEIAAWIAHETCAGLEYAHTRTSPDGAPLNVIHRDISPQNIQLSREGEVKIVDFGIAKAEQRNSQTQHGVIKGKYSYMSPEQAWGDHIDHRSDIFAVGICLFEMLAGEVLYDANEGLGLLEQVRLAQIPNLREIRPDLPQELERIVYRALAAEPSQRFQSAEEMRAELAQYLFNAKIKSGRQILVAFMDEILNSQPYLDDGGATQAVSADLFKQFIPQPQPQAELPEDFSGQDRTRAVSADLFRSTLQNTEGTMKVGIESTRAMPGETFAQLMTPVAVPPHSTPAPLPTPAPLFVPSSQVSSSSFGSDQSFETEEKTRALSASDFQSFQSGIASSAQTLPSLFGSDPLATPSSFEGDDEKTRALSLNSMMRSTVTPNLLNGAQGIQAAPRPSAPTPPPAVPTPSPAVPTPPPSLMSQTFSFPDPSPRDNGDGAGVVLSSLPESDVRSALRSTGSFPDPSPRGYHSEEGAEPQATSPDQEEVTRGKKERKSREKKEAKEAQENPKSGKTKEKPSGASRKQRSNPIKYVLIVVIILAVIFGGATLVNKLLAPSIPEQYQLSVSGLPPGARIYLDGQDTGMKTPALLQGLKPDVEYLIKLTAAGYESKEQTFVARGEELVKKPNPDARIFLNPAKGQIRINSVPPNATVRMGGEIIGKTPLIRKGVTRAPGDIRIDFLLKGCKPETRSFAWGDRVEEELSIKLKCDK